jgi:hypothetical protein
MLPWQLVAKRRSTDRDHGYSTFRLNSARRPAERERDIRCSLPEGPVSTEPTNKPTTSRTDYARQTIIHFIPKHLAVQRPPVFERPMLFGRFPGSARLSWYDQHVGEEQYGALVEWY